MSRIRFLSADHVVAIHAELLDRYGGTEGGGHRGSDYQGVEAAVQAVKNSYYQSFEELAAAYTVYIIQGHVFMDGNKRAAAAALMTFFEGNGRRAKLGNEVLFFAMLELQARSERGELTDSLVSWLASLLVP